MATTYFKIRKEEDSYLEFELSNVPISLANGMRRIILSEIETYAIDEKDIKFVENTGPLHNEYNSHRISLIPINQTYEDLEKLEFYISKPFTKNVAIENDQSGILEITTNDVQVFHREKGEWVQNKQEIFDGVYLITKLNLKQKILGSFNVSKGISKQHSRWQCVNTISYRYKLNKDLIEGQSYDGVSLQDEQQDWLKDKNGEPVGFVFYLESLGSFSPRAIIQKSLEILEVKCVTFQEFLDSNRKNVKYDESNGMIELEYEGETHTLGNLISTIGLNMLGEEDFLGYRIVHPMLEKFIMRMRISREDKYLSKDENIQILLDIVDRILSVLEELKKEWKSV